MAAPSSIVPVMASKTKTKKKHFVAQKVKLFRASDPLLSVLMWGVNHSVSAAVRPTPARPPRRGIAPGGGGGTGGTGAAPAGCRPSPGGAGSALPSVGARCGAAAVPCPGAGDARGPAGACGSLCPPFGPAVPLAGSGQEVPGRDGAASRARAAPLPPPAARGRRMDVLRSGKIPVISGNWPSSSRVRAVRFGKCPLPACAGEGKRKGSVW